MHYNYQFLCLLIIFLILVSFCHTCIVYRVDHVFDSPSFVSVNSVSFGKSLPFFGRLFFYFGGAYSCALLQSLYTIFFNVSSVCIWCVTHLTKYGDLFFCVARLFISGVYSCVYVLVCWWIIWAVCRAIVLPKRFRFSSVFCFPYSCVCMLSSSFVVVFF